MKYKLKEECKKYFNSNKNEVQEYSFFALRGISEEALEKVEERVEVDGSYLIQPNITQINIIGDYSEQIEDIEKFLNVFGSWDYMESIAEEYAEYYDYTKNPIVLRKRN